MTWQHVQHPIAQLNHDRRLSLKDSMSGREALDHVIKSQSLIITLDRGYVAHCYSSANYFKNNLTLAVYEKSYND